LHECRVPQHMGLQVLKDHIDFSRLQLSHWRVQEANDWSHEQLDLLRHDYRRELPVI
jgi:hypothetical protein